MRPHFPFSWGVQELYVRAHESHPHTHVSRVCVNDARIEGGCSSISMNGELIKDCRSMKARRSLHVPKSSRIAVLDQDIKIEA